MSSLLVWRIELNIVSAPISAKKKPANNSSGERYSHALTNPFQYLRPSSYRACMFLKALCSKSDWGLYPYGQLGQSLSQALRHTSSWRHSSWVIDASIFFVGSSKFNSAALTMPKPKAPIPDFSKSASFDIQ